jgi:hypothetical protein
MGDVMPESPANRLEPYLIRYGARPPAPEIEPRSWGEVAEGWEQRLQSLLGEHPKLTVAAAAAVGLVLGWMVKRK